MSVPISINSISYLGVISKHINNKLFVTSALNIFLRYFAGHTKWYNKTLTLCDFEIFSAISQISYFLCLRKAQGQAHWEFLSIKEAYEYYRFFGSGQTIWSGVDSVLNLSNVNDLKKGLIGRYYFKENQLRIQLFYPVSISRSISKTYGFIKDENIFTYNETPETWFGSYGLTKSFGKNKMQEWKKQKMILDFSSRPDW